MSMAKLKKTGLHGCCNRQMVKRGLWSPEEDEKLIKYMNTYRHTSWSVVPKIAGLQRCGKSCRLRWMNYLRPDLKKGAFTTHEAKSVLELHKIFGNKWSQIAKFLEGRTDNVVKNFWNSTVKKKIFNHRKQKINVSANASHQPASSQMLPVVAIFNDPINGNKIPIMMNPSSPLMTNKHIIASPPLVPLYTTASAMTTTSPPQAVPLFQLTSPFEENQLVPEPSSTIFNHGQQQIITDHNVHQLADSSIAGRGIFGQVRNRNPPPELHDQLHLGFGTNETMAVEDSSAENSLLFDQLVDEIHERGREVQFMLNNLTAQKHAFPHVDPNADEVFHEINNGNLGERVLKAHGRVHPNHINNIESLMVSFAPAVNNSAASGVNPSTQATTQFPNDGDGNYIEHPYHIKNCYGSIWGSQP